MLYSLGKDNPDLVQKFFPFVKNLKASIFHDVSKTSGNFPVSTVYPKVIHLQPHQVLLVFAVLGQSSFVSEQAAGLSPCIVWTWLSHYRWKESSKTRSVQSKQVLFFFFFWRAGADTQLPAPCLPAWSLFPPKETNSSFSLCGLQVQSRDGWALVSSQCRVVILQPTLAEVSTAFHLPQPSQSPLRWKRFAYKQTPLKDTSTLTFLSPFSHLLPFQTPLARLPCSHMRPNYQNNN